MHPFFFISAYDNVSGSILASILNTHPDIECSTSYIDPLIASLASQYHCEPVSLDDFIINGLTSNKKFPGNAQRFSIFELQHKTLTEKTVSAYRKANIIVSPMMRINFILHCWKQLGSTENLVNIIQAELETLEKNQHTYIECYILHSFIEHISNTISKEKIADLNDPEVKLFIWALAKVIAFDSADIPTPGKSFSFEALLNDENEFVTFVNYLTNNNIELTSEFRTNLTTQLQTAAQTIEQITFAPWKTWQTDLLHHYITTRLHTVYYPHIDKPLTAHYLAAGCQFASLQTNKKLYSKLISIQLNSNRPSQLAAYLDNVEETADHPEDIEVIVNIDIGAHVMKALLEREIPRRRFTLKYIETPRPDSFCDLWKPLNKILEVTDPDCYFLLNISDEMFFTTQGWDTLLKKYIGFFPDHIFRLRASRNKFRNYFDRWECGFAQDSIPITTKKWVDIGGDWNPCFGPDSYQQLIAFYLAKEGQFSNANYLRELPLLDIQFAGDVPAIGIAAEKRWKHNRDHIEAMFISQSYKMQLEARRRAVTLRAHIVAYKEQITNFEIKTIENKKQIHLIDKEHNTTITFSYKMNWLSINLVNQWRKLHFFNYFGNGIENKNSALRGFARYLKAKYQAFETSHKIYMYFKRKLKSIIKNSYLYKLRKLKRVQQYQE